MNFIKSLKWQRVKSKKIIKIIATDTQTKPAQKNEEIDQPVAEIPVLPSSQDPETAYISSFSDKERKAYEIAKSHLFGDVVNINANDFSLTFEVTTLNTNC